MDVSVWDKVGVVAESVAALGTLAAVIVALWLAKHQGAPRVQVRAGIYTVISGGPPPRSIEGRVLRIAVVNTSLRDVVISGVGWRIGVLHKVHFFQPPVDGQLPRKLAPAEEANFTVPWENFEKGSAKIRNTFTSARFPRLRLRTARVAAYLSTGEEFYAKPDALLLEFFATGKTPTRPAA